MTMKNHHELILSDPLSFRREHFDFNNFSYSTQPDSIIVTCHIFALFHLKKKPKLKLRAESRYKGRHTPDAIRQRGTIFHFSKANKSVHNRKLWQI